MPIAALRMGRRTTRQRREPGEPVGERDDSAGDRAAGGAVLVERGVRAACEHGGERVGKDDGILDAQVHALPTRRAVHVRGVACDQQPPRAVRVGDAVVDTETRAPHHVGDDDPPSARSAFVEHPLHELGRRFLRGVDDRRHDAVAAVR